MICDALVLGGGPAGATTALGLTRHGRKVCLVDWPCKRPPLGESLPPGAVPLLELMGLRREFERQGHLRTWSTKSAWGGEDLRDQDFTFHPYGSAWQLDRAAFQDLLLAAARSAGTHILRAPGLKRVVRSAGGLWSVDFDAIGTIAARFIVDATGRRSSFARALGHRRLKQDRLVATTICRAPRKREDAIGFVLVEAQRDGWWYAASAPAAGLIATYMTDSDLLPARRDRRLSFFLERLDETLHVRAMFPPEKTSTILVTCPAQTASLDLAGGDGWIAVGDAAISLDPLSSAGLCNALEMGLRGAAAIHGSLSGDPEAIGKYASTVEQEMFEYNRLRHSFYAMERRWRDRAFWMRRRSVGRVTGATSASRARFSTREAPHANPRQGKCDIA
jgi:flavin-dependent dehydrogenase